MSKCKGGAALTLAVIAKEHIWLWDVRHGASIQEIAAREELSPRRVRAGIARAQALEKSTSGDTAESKIRPPRLEALFPITSYTPLSICPHRRAIERDSIFCCMVCHQSGVDDHPALQRSHATDPKPEQKPPPPCMTGAKTKSRETRRQRRARIYGTPSTVEPGAGRQTSAEATPAVETD